MKKQNKKGFTITELVIVIAVIAILAAVLIPTFTGVISKANQSKALQEAENAYKAAMAEAIADGVVDNTDIIYLAKDGTVTTVDGTNKEWTFTFANAQTATVDRTTDDGYTYAVANGVVTVTKS